MKPALSDTLEVWLDSDLGPACRVGTLAHDRGQIRFRYHPRWLHDARAFALDPDLSLDGAPFYGLSHAQAVDVVASVVAVVWMDGKPAPGPSDCPMPTLQERKEPFRHIRATGSCQSSHQSNYKNSSCSRLSHKAYSPICLGFCP